MKDVILNQRFKYCQADQPAIECIRAMMMVFYWLWVIGYSKDMTNR
jgi:hypothetical protein